MFSEVGTKLEGHHHGLREMLITVIFDAAARDINLLTIRE